MLLEKMRDARTALHEAEAAHPNSPALAKLHASALRLLYLAHQMGFVTQSQRDELAMPQDGGTPKTPPPPDPE